MAVDDDARPIEVPVVSPETPDEVRRFEKAKLRREHRLKTRGE